MTFVSIRAGLRPAAASILLAFAAMAANAAPAAAADVFEVRNVAVDVEAATAAEARRTALMEAERRAFYALIERLTLSTDHDRLPELGQEDISAHVRDFSVAREKASSVRYIARLDYRFKADAIRDLLRSYAIPFAETPSRPMLVLPVFEVGARAVLWDEPNPWRQAWSLRDAPAGLVPLAVPLGDLTDISTIGAADAMAADQAKLAAVAERHGAAASIVAHANLTATGGAPQTATVTLLRPADPLPAEARTAAVSQLPDEDLETFLGRAVEATIERIEDTWKRENLIYGSGTGVLAVTVPITALSDWLAVKEQIAAVGIIRDSDIVLISRQEVRVNIHYVGDPAQLVTALEQADLSLLQEAGEWVVMPIGAFRPPRT